MIFKRAIVAELANTASAVFTVLFSIIFSVGLVRILGDAAGGQVDSRAVFAIVALTALTWLPVVLILTLFISVLMTLSRAFRDSEMVIWFASGQSLLAWVLPVVRFSVPVVLLVALLSLAAAPWANRQIAESKERFIKRDDVSKVMPGRFIESGNGDRVFFVEAANIDAGTVRNIFVSHRSQGHEGVTVAAQGVIEARPDGERFLVLERGRRYEGVPGQAEYRTLEFEKYAIRLETSPDAPLLEIAARAKPTQQLLRERSPWNDAELIWRFGMPVITLVLALLAIPLSYTNPRIGRSFNLIVAVFLFFLYLTSLQVVQGLVAQSRLSLAAGALLPHALALATTLLLFARRVYWQRWLPPWPLRRRDRAAGA